MTHDNRAYHRDIRCLLTVCLFCVFLAGCTPAQDSPNEINVATLSERLAEGVRTNTVFVLDVRTYEEFAGGHIPGATNIPHTELEARLSEVSPAAQVVVYCERGGRARDAIHLLSRSGYGAVTHLQGDMVAWRLSGMPVATP